MFYIQDEIDEQYIIEKGDFLVAMSGATTGKMGVYTYGEISYLNQRVGKIKASKALYTPYMHYLMYSQVDNILKWHTEVHNPILVQKQFWQ